MVSPELVDACKRGDPRAFEELVDATHRQVYTLALRLVGDRQEAEDVAQEAYLRVFRGLSGFRGESAIETWLYRIVTNAAMNQLRRKGRFGDLAAEPQDLEDAAAETVADTERVADRDELDRALARLPEAARMVVVMKDMYGLTCEEIGRELGVSEGAIKVRLHRARRRLKDLVYGQEAAVSHEV